jgi:SAM-dependent methyltransferase
VTQAYVSAISKFLAGFEQKPDVVDLGCGDFQVGAQLRDLCGAYIACDIVRPLIDFNRRRFAGRGVDFRVLDLSVDELPPARVAFVRQVLQHLSNQAILRAVPALSTRYEYLVVTEHLPATPGFEPNRDKATGPDNRVRMNSGVVLTSPPFNLEPRQATKICEVEEDAGVITTVVYRMKA